MCSQKKTNYCDEPWLLMNMLEKIDNHHYYHLLWMSSKRLDLDQLPTPKQLYFLACVGKCLACFRALSGRIGGGVPDMFETCFSYFARMLGRFWEAFGIKHAYKKQCKTYQTYSTLSNLSWFPWRELQSPLAIDTFKWLKTVVGRNFASNVWNIFSSGCS